MVQLICLFTIEPELDHTIGMISKTYEVVYKRIFILSIDSSDELICSFNVEKGNVKEIRDAINNIKNNTKKIIYSVECRNHALKKFNALNTYNSYFELYKKIIQN